MRSILTSLPSSICSAAWRSTLEPMNCGSNVAPAPNAPPITVPTPGAIAEPAIAPRRAPPAMVAKLAPCPANARGIWDTASPAADSKPFSWYAFLTGSKPTPSPASLPIASLRATPALAASSGLKILPIPERVEDTSCLPPRISSLPIVDSLGGAA